jgi:hypothetical protein
LFRDGRWKDVVFLDQKDNSKKINVKKNKNEFRGKGRGERKQLFVLVFFFLGLKDLVCEVPSTMQQPESSQISKASPSGHCSAFLFVFFERHLVLQGGGDRLFLENFGLLFCKPVNDGRDLSIG